jgi:hypothetical protein
MKGKVGVTMRFPRLAFVVALTLAGALAAGCDAARRDWRTCFHTSDCGGSNRVCTKDHLCVPVVLDGAVWDGRQPDAPRGQGIDGAPAQVTFDGSSVDGSASVDASDDVPISVASMDGAAALDSDTEAGSPGFIDGGAIDVHGSEVPGACASDNDCTGKGASYCVQGQCVSCKTGDACSGGTPICSVNHACVSCAAVDAGCPAATPACEAESGRCVECLGDGDCVRDATKSFCRARLCVGCAAAGASACAARNPAKPVCAPGGTCAECTTSDDCKAAAKPICDTPANACVACTSDTQCSAKVGGPGVCMFQQDGHCATDAESVYVGKSATGTCSDSGASAGSAQVPYCTAQTAVGVAKATGRPVVVVMGQVQGGFATGALSRPLTIVGKNAVIKPNDYADGIGITSGEIYLRKVTVAANSSGVTNIGVNVQAATGATVALHMDGCTIQDNPGGGLFLAGASFDIQDSVVTGNGPGQTTGGTIWGGIRVESLPTGAQASLSRVTIRNNRAPGLTCTGAIQGHGVLASSNTTLDIAASCGVDSCATPSSACGAQPQP